MSSPVLTRLLKLFTPAQYKLGFRAGVAAVAAYGLAYGLSLPNGYWAVLTAVLVVQSTIGASLSVAVDRALGTVVGGVVGVVAAIIAGPSMGLTFLTLAVAVFVTSTLAAKSAKYKLAPVTVVIVVLSDPSHLDPWVSGLHRVFEIGVGGVVGVLCALLVLPARALFFLFPYCATAVRLCATLLALGRDGVLGRGLDPARIDSLNTQARNALRAADARIAEAKAERALSGYSDPTPVVRSCRRLWHSVIILLRGADATLSAPLVALVSPHLDAAVAGLADYMSTLARRLDGEKDVDVTGAALTARAAVSALQGEVDRLNAGGNLDSMGGAELTALFAAISACGHVRDNLDDLAQRLAEMDASGE